VKYLAPPKKGTALCTYLFRNPTSWKWWKMKVRGQFQAPTALLPGKEPPVRFVPDAVWTLELVWTLWRRETSFVPAGNFIPRPSSPLPAIIPPLCFTDISETIHSNLINTRHATVNWQMPQQCQSLDILLTKARLFSAGMLDTNVCPYVTIKAPLFPCQLTGLL
jgi:hypothetical protein